MEGGGRRVVVFKPLGARGVETAWRRLPGVPGHFFECAYKRILTKHLAKGSVSTTHRRPQRALS